MIRGNVVLARLAVLSLLVGCALLVGCESYTPDAGVTVTGKLVQGGQPIDSPRLPNGYGGVEVIFVGATHRASTFCDAAGDFEITYAGGGIAPGKYKVAVIVHGMGPSEDKLGGKLNETATKIEVDVPESKLGKKHDVGTIDVATHLK